MIEKIVCLNVSSRARPPPRLVVIVASLAPPAMFSAPLGTNGMRDENKIEIILIIKVPPLLSLRDASPRLFSIVSVAGDEF